MYEALIATLVSQWTLAGGALRWFLAGVAPSTKLQDLAGSSSSIKTEKEKLEMGMVVLRAAVEATKRIHESCDEQCEMSKVQDPLADRLYQYWVEASGLRKRLREDGTGETHTPKRNKPSVGNA
jgi:hypothetical protein